MKLACQIFLATMMGVAFLRMLWTDFYGQKATSPWGFQGCVITFVLTVLMVAIYWKAGAYSLLLGE